MTFTNDFFVWCSISGFIVFLELMTGTFFLLMLSIGTIAGAVAALLGTTIAIQLVTAALTSTCLVLGWYFYRKKHQKTDELSNRRNVHLDVGETIQIAAWQDDGTTYVQYRGAQWHAKADAGQLLQPGTWRISDIQGNQLIVQPC